jgi:hypothetical protein
MTITLKYSKKDKTIKQDFCTYSQLGKWITENSYRLNIISIKIKGN